MNKINKIHIGATVVVIILIAGAFYGGMIFGQGKRGGSNFPGGQNQSMSIRGNKQGGSLNSGEIIAKDEKSVTIKLINGGSKIIFFSSSTEVGKFVTGTITDLELGKTIMVQGQTNQDGSVTAQSIQIRPDGYLK